MIGSTPAKEASAMTYPKSLTSIVVSVGGLALFLIMASTLLVSQPIGSTIRSYFYTVNPTENLFPPIRATESSSYGDENGNNADELSANLDSTNSTSGVSSGQDDSVKGTGTSENKPVEAKKADESPELEQEVRKLNASVSNGSVSPVINKNYGNIDTLSPVENFSGDSDRQESNKTVASLGEPGKIIMIPHAFVMGLLLHFVCISYNLVYVYSCFHTFTLKILLCLKY